jgi:WD40 repeat protein
MARCAAVLLATLLGGCSSDDPPQKAWDLTAQGILTGTISEDASLALVGSLNHGGSLWRIVDRERLFDWNHRAGTFSAFVATALSPDGTRAVTAEPRSLVLWDAATGTALGFWASASTTRDLALAPDGRTILIGQEDHSAVLFDGITGNHLHTLLHDGPVNSVALATDGRTALTGSDDNTAKLWDTASGALKATFGGDSPVRLVALSPHAITAFTAGERDQVTLWDAAAGSRLHTLQPRNSGVTTARFSADDSQLLIGFVNRRVELWDVSRGVRIQTWNPPARNRWRTAGSAVLAVAFTAQPGAYLALTGDGQLAELGGR